MNGNNSAYLMAMKGLIEAAKRFRANGDPAGFQETIDTAVESLAVASKQLHQDMSEAVVSAEKLISEEGIKK